MAAFSSQMSDPFSHLRLLLVGSTAPGSLENAYLRAFSKLGVEATLFDAVTSRLELPRTSLLTRGLNRMLLSNVSALVGERRFLNFIRARPVDYDAIVVFKGTGLSRRVLESSRDVLPDACWINLNPDDPLDRHSRGSTNSNIVSGLTFYDLYCTWSPLVAERLAAHGCRNVTVVPFGFDPDFHIPPSRAPVEPRSVSFVGAWDEEREAVLAALSDFELRIYGDGWDRASRRSGLRHRCVPRNIYGHEFAAALASANASLNLLRHQNRGSHNMRTFEIPAVAGLMVTTRSAEQAAFFPEGVGCLMFDDTCELREQLHFAFREQAEGLRIRSAGHKLAAGHSYTQRARELLLALAGLPLRSYASAKPATQQ